MHWPVVNPLVHRKSSCKVSSDYYLVRTSMLTVAIRASQKAIQNASNILRQRFEQLSSRMTILVARAQSVFFNRKSLLSVSFEQISDFMCTFRCCYVNGTKIYSASLKSTQHSRTSNSKHVPFSFSWFKLLQQTYAQKKNPYSMLCRQYLYLI